MNQPPSVPHQTIGRQLLSRVMENEAQAYHFYMDMAHRSADPATAKVFQEMAEQELGPCDVLAFYQSNPSLQVKFSDLSLAQDQADEAMAPPWEATSSVKMVTMALKKCRQAGKFYQRVAQACTDAEFRDFYNHLARMKRYQRRVLHNMVQQYYDPDPVLSGSSVRTA